MFSVMMRWYLVMISFYSLLDVHGFRHECGNLCDSLLAVPASVTVSESEEASTLARINPRKAVGLMGCAVR
jgi:hypothetical protein